MIGAPELKAIFGVFDVPRTGNISLDQYKQGASCGRARSRPHARAHSPVPPTQCGAAAHRRRAPHEPAAMKAAGVPPGLYNDKPEGFMMANGDGRIKLQVFVDEGCAPGPRPHRPRRADPPRRGVVAVSAGR